MKNETYTITPEQVLQFLQDIKLPATIEIRQGEQIIDVPLFISTNVSRMHGGIALLENQSRRRMLAMARLIHEFNHDKK